MSLVFKSINTEYIVLVDITFITLTHTNCNRLKIVVWPLDNPNQLQNHVCNLSQLNKSWYAIWFSRISTQSQSLHIAWMDPYQPYCYHTTGQRASKYLFHKINNNKYWLWTELLIKYIHTFLWPRHVYTMIRIKTVRALAEKHRYEMKNIRHYLAQREI